MYSIAVPEWRNWQTQKTQNLPPSGAWGFESLLGHQIFRYRMARFQLAAFQLTLVRTMMRILTSANYRFARPSLLPD
jgi:hypothetical protein